MSDVPMNTSRRGDDDMVAVLIVDAAGHVLHVDEEAETRLGATASTLCGADIRELFVGLVKQNETVARVAVERVIRHCTVRMGAQGEMAVTARVRPLNGGQEARFLVTFAPKLDVDPAAHERIHAELEAKNKALEAARFEADQANLSKSRFLAMMSHEIRTPLNGVLGMTSVLLDSLQDSTQREIVETIRTSGDTLLTIINDILDFSKIEAGLMDLEEQPFALRHCLDDVIDLVGSQARKKFIELNFVVEPDVPLNIDGDISRLRQVLVNLVGNALKFTDAGEVVVTVKRGSPAPPDKIQLHFSVRDTGIGIAPERMGRLFQTFTQVDASINRKYGGTGLGLAICKRLVELMGGQIWVDSVPGEGTTFQFTIPTTPALDAKNELLDAIATARRDLAGKRVLIADDNVLTRQILSEQIKSFGMVPTAASSGGAALEILRATRVNAQVDVQGAFMLVLLDLEMAEMQGYQIIAALREDIHLAELPIVLLTASAASPTALAKQWQTPCLSKPVKTATLLDAMMRAFLHSSQHSSRGPRSIPIDSTLGLRWPLRILLAEDNVINQKVALLLLDRAGYRADVAANGQEVLDAVSKQAYDLILMDVQMPEMDGLEASQRLRGPGPWLGKPRIVAMTANVMQEGREACVAAGMDDFLVKPVRIPELIRILERTARQSRAPTLEETWAPGDEAQLEMPEEIIDQVAFGALRSVCELDGNNALASLVQDFIADSRKMLADMENLILQGEYSTLERLAHTLKGTAGTFGAKSLSRMMAELESAAKQRANDALRPLVDAAMLEHARVATALESLC